MHVYDAAAHLIETRGRFQRAVACACSLSTNSASLMPNNSAQIVPCSKIRSVMLTKRKFLCSVYVVLVNPKVVNTPQIKRRNPKRDPLKPCVYVGLTGLRVDRYFDYRRVKTNSNTWPLRKYGIRLIPELYKHLNRMPFERAVHRAEKLAADLRAEGYTVTNAVSASKERYLRVKASLARECAGINR
jgi:hypothetical protein